MNTSLKEGPAQPDPLHPYAKTMHDRFDVSRSTSDRMLASGNVSVVRIGRRVLIRESEINRLIADAERAERKRA